MVGAGDGREGGREGNTMRHRRLLRAAVLGLALALGGSSITVAAPSLDFEVNVSSNLLGLRFPNNNATEPNVAVDPNDPSNIAVTYNTRGAKCGLRPVVRISRDGGATWKTGERNPWAGSGRQPNWHPMIAWGPGPRSGRSRLYWADTTVRDCSYSDHRLSVAYSDDFGATWSPLYVHMATPATSAGGFPDITVDRNPSSPNFGAVYAAINWFARSSDEPGYQVIASSDFGRTWSSTEVPALPPRAGYGFRYRIGYRLRTGPDGSLYASFCQRDRRGPTGAVGRLAFGVARVAFNPAKGTLASAAPVLATTVNVNAYNLGSRAAPGTADKRRLNTCMAYGLDVDATNGDVYLAVANFRPKVNPGPRGRVLLGRAPAGLGNWNWSSVPVLPPADGRPQSAHKPTLAVDGRTVFVGFQSLSDVGLGSGTNPQATVVAGYAVSYDRGGSWAPVAQISTSRWHPDWLDHSRNGAGLRDRAELVTPGRAIYVFGDGRHAAAKPSNAWGRGQIYAALVQLGAP
jgi:hypothetical protein